MESRIFTRRRLIGAGLLAVVSAVLAACSRRTTSETTAGSSTSTSGAAGATTLAPTPPCGDDDAATPAQTEGPYFTPNSPEKADLAADVARRGTPLVLTGAVVTTGCRPVDRALVDVWHADDGGEYDNDGYRLRGHVFTDAQGRYRFDTIVPGLYPGRTRHYHVKVQAPGGPVLTTQLYFPGEPGNADDGLYRDELLLEMDRQNGAYTFVVADA